MFHLLSALLTFLWSCIIVSPTFSLMYFCILKMPVVVSSLLYQHYCWKEDMFFKMILDTIYVHVQIHFSTSLRINVLVTVREENCPNGYDCRYIRTLITTHRASFPPQTYLKFINKSTYSDFFLYLQLKSK